MKKLFIAVCLTIGTALAPAAQAGVGTWGLGIVWGATMFGVNQNTTPKPTPYHLTDACKPKSVQAVNGNYFYTTYEHCIKEAK